MRRTLDGAFQGGASHLFSPLGQTSVPGGCLMFFFALVDPSGSSQLADGGGETFFDAFWGEKFPSVLFPPPPPECPSGCREKNAIFFATPPTSLQMCGAADSCASGSKSKVNSLISESTTAMIGRQQTVTLIRESESRVIGPRRQLTGSEGSANQDSRQILKKKPAFSYLVLRHYIYNIVFHFFSHPTILYIKDTNRC